MPGTAVAAELATGRGEERALDDYGAGLRVPDVTGLIDRAVGDRVAAVIGVVAGAEIVIVVALFHGSSSSLTSVKATRSSCLLPRN